jgi:hypothetical protein
MKEDLQGPLVCIETPKFLQLPQQFLVMKNWKTDPSRFWLKTTELVDQSILSTIEFSDSNFWLFCLGLPIKSNKQTSIHTFAIQVEPEN